MFDEPMKLYAAASDYDDAHDLDDDDTVHRFNDEDEEEEMTMTSDDDEHELSDEEDSLPGEHAEDATIYMLPPSPVEAYTPATELSTPPVQSEAVAPAPVKAPAKKAKAPA